MSNVAREVEMTARFDPTMIRSILSSGLSYVNVVFLPSFLSSFAYNYYCHVSSTSPMYFSHRQIISLWQNRG